MTAHDNVNKYQFHAYQFSPLSTRYLAYKGNEEVGDMTVYHNHAEEEGKARVMGLYARPEHRHVAATLLGIGATQVAAMGRTLVPPKDLSPHSSKLVKGLQDRGLVTGTRSNEVLNSMDWPSPRYVSPEKRRGQRLNTEEVNEGRTFIREKIRKRRDAS